MRGRSAPNPRHKALVSPGAAALRNLNDLCDSLKQKRQHP
jgi:hypothetical protein